MITWKKQKLKDICTRIDYGYTASASKTPIGPKFLRITDIVPSLIDWDIVPYCAINNAEKEKYLLKDGDIVIARTGATTGYAKALKNPPESVFASYLVRFRVNDSNDEQFIGQVLESDLYKRYIKKNLNGAAQPQANAQILGSYELLLPDLIIQRKISSIISSYTDLIENNEKRIKIMEEMAQRLYTEWFVKFKFPGHEKVKMVDSPLGKIPEGWEITKISDILSPVRRKLKIKNSEYLENGNIPVVDQGKNFISGYTNLNEAMYKETLILFGDHTRVLKYCNFEFACGADGTQILLSNDLERMPQILLYYSLLNVGLKNYHYARHFKFLKSLKILKPDHLNAIEFDRIVSPIHDQIKVFRNMSLNLRIIRDLLIVQFVTGRRELKNV